MAEEHLGEPIIASSSRETESVSSVPCAICRRQFSRYTCPRCNVPYCSLVCFRSEKHGDCSESFYRKEVELDVKNAPSASTEEKRRMMELLKRFEEDSLDDSPLLDDSDNEDEDGTEDLQKRLQSVDLDTASYDELWAALSPAERDKFLRAVNDPSSELAQQLLASEELEKAQVEPWWEPESPANTQPGSSDVSLPRTAGRRNRGREPSIMEIPAPLVKQAGNNVVSGPLLLYNICALCIAYTYAVRHFVISPLSGLSPADPDRVEARQSISRLAPFLVDRRSTTVHTSLSVVVTDLWSRFPPNDISPQLFSLLLKDAATLLRPATVTVVTPPDEASRNSEEHPSANALRMLSDLASLFTEPQNGGGSSTTSTAQPTKAKVNHVMHKLMFYAAYVLGTPGPMLRILADEATMRAKTLENEGMEVGRNLSSEVKRVGNGKARTARIEEL